MIFAGDTVTVFLGTATLLLLSLYTLINCRAQLPTQSKSYGAFLYEGKSKRYSLAGTIGYAFSVTYYGATTIYGHLYRGWFILLLLAALLVSIFLVRTVLDVAQKARTSAEGNSNLLLDLLRIQLGDPNLQWVLRVYMVIYFLLLVEELAVSRLALVTVFPSHPAITAVLLATACMVILLYLNWGGFKAILIADYEQLKLLFPFILAVAFLIYRNPRLTASSRGLFQPRASADPSAFPLALILLVSWIVAGVDFYSRLNFQPSGDGEVVRQRKAFATLALSVTSGVFVIGAFFGMSLPAKFSLIQSPIEFTKAGMNYTLMGGSKATSVIFFASLFCMIFTTLNTLAFTLFQLGFYRPRKSPHIKDIHRIFLWAVFLSCLMWPNSVSAIGLFIAALMFIPLFAILACIYPHVQAIVPKSFSFSVAALGMAIAIFVLLYRNIETTYSSHHLLVGIVAGSTLLCAVVAKMFELFERNRRKANEPQDHS